MKLPMHRCCLRLCTSSLRVLKAHVPEEICFSCRQRQRTNFTGLAQGSESLIQDSGKGLGKGISQQILRLTVEFLCERGTLKSSEILFDNDDNRSVLLLVVVVAVVVAVVVVVGVVGVIIMVVVYSNSSSSSSST